MVVGLQVVFVLAVLGGHLKRGIWPSPVVLGAGGLAALLVFFQSHRVWFALVPFAMVGLSYQSLGNLSHSLDHGQIHIEDLIAWERSLFGGVIPVTVLQDRLFDRPYTLLLDLLSNALYFSHFVAPPLAGIILWRWRKDFFWDFAFVFLSVSYLGFATYVLFPAAPPWWAHLHGYLPDSIDLSHFLLSIEAMQSTPNPVAAMPSLHCAYPLLISLMAGRLWGGRVHLLHLFPLAVGFAVVYLGHHYVIDVLAGYLYAAAGFVVFEALGRSRNLGFSGNSWSSR